MEYRGRLRRAVMAFAIALVAVLPAAAVAAAPGDVTGQVEEQGGREDPGRPEKAPADGGGTSDEAPGKSEEDPGRSGTAPGRSDLPSTDTAPGRSGLAPGRVDGPPPRHVGAAFVMLDVPDDEPVVVVLTPAEPVGLSGGLVSVLTPVVPPVVVDAVTSPIVVIEVLVEAMASSGQVLVIPFLAAGIGFLMPGLRRRDVVAAVVSVD